MWRRTQTLQLIISSYLSYYRQNHIDDDYIYTVITQPGMKVKRHILRAYFIESSLLLNITVRCGDPENCNRGSGIWRIIEFSGEGEHAWIQKKMFLVCRRGRGPRHILDNFIMNNNIFFLNWFLAEVREGVGLDYLDPPPLSP